MSQINRIELSGSSLVGIQPSSGSRVRPVNNEIFIIGSTNISTSASGSTVTASLKNLITIDSAQIGNVLISGNTISTTNSDGNIIFAPNGTGKLQVDYAFANSAAVLDSSSNIVSTNTMTNGQIAIGSTGSTPVSANITAGNGIVITNGPGSITISADSGSGFNSAVSWSVQTYTGVGSKTYDASPNSGYIANSTVGSPAASVVTGYCPRTPVIYNVTDSSNWTVGDQLLFTDRNKGGYYVQFRSGQNVVYNNYSGQGNYRYNFVPGPNSGNLIPYAETFNGVESELVGQTSITTTYFSGLSYIYLGSVKYAATTFPSAAPTVTTYNGVFMEVNIMGNTGSGSSSSSTPISSGCRVV